MQKEGCLESLFPTYHQKIHQTVAYPHYQIWSTPQTEQIAMDTTLTNYLSPFHAICVRIRLLRSKSLWVMLMSQLYRKAVNSKHSVPFQGSSVHQRIRIYRSRNVCIQQLWVIFTHFSNTRVKEPLLSMEVRTPLALVKNTSMSCMLDVVLQRSSW